VTLSLLRPGDVPLRIGHRGAAAIAPENTLESFAAAVELGVDGVEFDVVAGARGLEIAHDVGRDGAFALDDALVFFAARPGTILQVDLKAGGREPELVEMLRRRELLERTLVSSFSAASLRAVSALEPELATSFTYPEDRLGLSRRRGLALAVRGGLVATRRMLPRRIAALIDRAGVSAATLHFALITPGVVRACHARGAAVWAWTVNEREVAAELADAGVDAIISDDPRIFRDPSGER
jgi:glycerophosphoryl diester phosphodiesterase